MANHAYFEGLAAMAACGQLTGTELCELQEHAKHCPTCGSQLIEMTHVGAHVFCAHAMKAPSSRMPKNMVDRFIARANSEGIPLDTRAKCGHMNRPTFPIAVFVTLVLLTAILYLRFPARWADEARPGDVASASSSTGNEKRATAEALANAAPSGEQKNRVRNRQRIIEAEREAALTISHKDGQRRFSRPARGDADEKQFNVAVYSHNLSAFYRSSFKMEEPDRVVRWPAPTYGAYQLRFVQPQNSTKNDPPWLLAECARWTFATWNTHDHAIPMPIDAEALRRDFETQASNALLKPSYRSNLPALQFTRNTDR